MLRFLVKKYLSRIEIMKLYGMFWDLVNHKRFDLG